MVKFEKLKTLNNEQFLRIVGLPQKCFNTLVEKINDQIERNKKENPIKNRGVKGSVTLEDKILITLYYLRHYPTLEVLGGIFQISKSYAHTIYKKYSSMMVKIFHVEGSKSLTSETFATILIDVTEQEIERPKKCQQEYYSGKKKTHNKSATGYLCCYISNIVCCLC